MKAIVITRPGGPEVLEVRDIPQPEPREREVLVRIRAAGLNRADLLQRMGRYPAPPGAPTHIPGLELAGRVERNGPQTSRWQKGDRVCGIVAGGAQAEYAVTHEDMLIPIPENLTWEDAGALPEVFITAQDALLQAGHKAGERVLIHAVGSGVGLAACQLVSAMGGRAFGTSRTREKIERAKQYGLIDGMTVDEASLGAQLSAFSQRLTADRGFDVVLDLNGGSYFAASLGVLATKGRLVLVGATAGARADIDLRQLLARRVTVIGTVLRARSLHEKIEVTGTFERDVLPLLRAGRVKPIIDHVFSMEEIADAHRLLESNTTFGKVVLKFGD
jgi:NADPH2:quinone reductase